MGLRIGATPEEVRYAFDEPSVVYDQPRYDPTFRDYLRPMFQVHATDPKLALPAGKSVKDYFGWAYEEPSRRLEVGFDPETRLVNEITCYAYLQAPSASNACPPLFGVKPLMSEDEVRTAVGQEDSTKYIGSSKLLHYEGLGLDIFLVKKQVYYIKKHAPSGNPLGVFLKQLLSIPLG